MKMSTGEIRDFDNISKEEMATGKWVEWNLSERVECKGCTFRVEGINIGENTILLKGIAPTQVR